MEIALKKFEAVLDEAIHSVWSAQKIDVRLDLLESEAQKITKAALNLGDVCFGKLEEDKESVENYIGTFLFPERVKSFLILWRDVLMNQQKAELLRLTEETSAGKLKALNEASKATVVNAAESFKDFLEKEKTKISNSKGGIQRAIADWKLQENPWGIYRSQIELLVKQCTELREEHGELKKAAGGFLTIQNITKSTLSDCLEDLNRWTTKAEETIGFITVVCDDAVPDPEQISGFVEEASDEITIVNRLALLTESIEKYTEEMPEKIRVPMSSNGGMIQFRAGDLRKLVRDWIESEVSPLMYEAWELTENTGNSFKMALVNILNRSVLLKNQVKENLPVEMEAAELTHPLSSFLKKTAPHKQNLRELQKILLYRLKTSLKLSEAYNSDKSFLAVPLESTMRQYKINRNRVRSDFQIWWRKNTKFVRDWMHRIEREDALSLSEKIVRYIQSRRATGENNMYRNIFETTGYIGESFWVGRKDELTRVEEVIGNWKLGFRGSVALTGERFSGKSLFGELVANRFFSAQTVHLHPESVIKFREKSFETSYDLEAALKFIKKQSKGSKTLVWLDNLELWQNRTFPLNRNVRALKKAIGESDNTFYLVSMTGWLRNHLARFHDLESIFQAEINLNRMSLPEVLEAILIRHGATHKTLFDEKTEREVTSAKFHALTREAYNAGNGNIGDSLSHWSNSIQKLTEEDVVYKQKESFPFPDFLNSENGLLLSSIILAKRIGERDLKMLFGPAFDEKYAGVLQQLIHVGLIERLPNGKLQIVQTAVNEVARLLEKKKFL